VSRVQHYELSTVDSRYSTAAEEEEEEEEEEAYEAMPSPWPTDVVSEH
jgi:hypothetical protein